MQLQMMINEDDLARNKVEITAGAKKRAAEKGIS